MNRLTTPDTAEPLTVREAASACRCSTPTIRRRVRSGELPAVQLGGPGSALRIPRAALNTWLWAEPRRNDAESS
jgi:excisionase family DNA binding protein